MVRTGVGGSGRLLSTALGAAAPVDDLGFIDLEARVVGGVEAGGRTHCARHIDESPTHSTGEVVVVVPHTVFEARRGASGLDAADDPLLRQHGEGVVHRLAGDRSDATANRRSDLVGASVGVGGHRLEHGDPLCCHLNTVFPQERTGIAGFLLFHTPIMVGIQT